MTPDADCRSVVYAVRNTTQQRDFQSFRDIFDRYLQEQASAADLLTVASAPLMTGFSALDELLGGIQRSDLIILAARPSVGKSTLALNIAMHNAKADQTCAIFSLEMTADQLVMRALASETGIDSHRIRIAAASKIAELGYSDNDDLEITLRQAEDTNLEKMVGAMVRTGNSTVRFTSFSPARRPGAVTQAVYFANMALLDRRACRMVAESGGPGWKQPCLRPRLGIPPCRSSGGGWKTRLISPWQDGILLPIPARGAAG